MAHGLKVRIVHDVETWQQLTKINQVADSCVAEDSVRVVEFISKVSDLVVEALPYVHHGTLGSLFDAGFHLVMDTGQLLVSDINPEVVVGYRHNLHLHPELIGDLVGFGVVSGFVSRPEEPLRIQYQLGILRHEAVDECLILTAFIAEVSHEGEVVGRGQDLYALDAPRQGVLVELGTYE